MFKSERREHKRNKRHVHKVSGRFDAQFNAMEKRERERKARIEARQVRAMKENAQ